MITDNFKKLLEDAYAHADSAKATKETALREYKKNRSNKTGHVDDKLDLLRKEIEAEKAENVKRPQLMADALGDGDVDSAAKIEKEIATANERISELEHKLELLSGATIKGDPALYKAAILSYRKNAAVVIKTREAIIDVIQEISDLIDELDSIRKDAQSNLNGPYKIVGDTPDEGMIAMVESFDGIIDVKGHSAGDDLHAKQRYVNGNIRGIENTPAGPKLSSWKINVGEE